MALVARGFYVIERHRPVVTSPPPAEPDGAAPVPLEQ